MNIRRIIGILISFVMIFGLFASFVQAALPQRTTVEYEKAVDAFIQNTVPAEHAMGVDYKGLTKSEINELKEIVESATEDCSSTRDKAFAIYCLIERTVDYSYNCGDNQHCTDRDCPVYDIENASGTSALMAYHIYKSGFGVCEDYANLSSVLMKMADIPTILIADMDGAHAFNAFYDGNRWVYFDSTWANQYNLEKHFDMSVEYMHSIGSHRLHSLQSLDKDGILYDVWFSEERYCYISGSLSGYETMVISPGLYGIKFVEDTPVMPTHPDVEKVIIEDGVTQIPDNLFKGCTNLTTIVFPDTLDRIGSYSFEKCTSLKDFTVPDSVTTLGTAIIEYSGVEYLKIGSSISNCPGTSFLNTEKLKKVEISEGVEEICYGMFMYCNEIEEIHLPSTLKKIENTAFYGMEPIEKIYYNGTREDWKKVAGGTLNPGISSKNIVFLKEPEVPDKEEIEPDNKDDEKENTENKPQEEKPKPQKDKELTEKNYHLREVEMPKPNSSSQGQTKKGKLSNIKKKNTYKNQFSDVKNGHWYAEYIQTAFETGIINGKPDGTFAPNDEVSSAEVIKMAVLINYYYNGLGDEKSKFTPSNGEKWYDPYMAYASDVFFGGRTIVGNPQLPATRYFTALIFASCLPDAEYPQTVDVTSIPDVPAYDDYYPYVMQLYRAGILSGNDDKGTFAPDSNLTRSEAVAIVTRVIDSAKRKGYKEHVSSDVKGNVYTESDWIKITKVEYLDSDTKYAHTITETQCYNIGDKDVYHGMEYMAITGKISLKNNIPDGATVLQGSYVKMPNGLKYAGHNSDINLRNGTFEFSLVKLIPSGKYVYTNVLSVNGELCRVNIHFTVK